MRVRVVVIDEILIFAEVLAHSAATSTRLFLMPHKAARYEEAKTEHGKNCEEDRDHLPGVRMLRCEKSRVDSLVKLLLLKQDEQVVDAVVERVLSRRLC